MWVTGRFVFEASTPDGTSDEAAGIYQGAILSVTLSTNFGGLEITPASADQSVIEVNDTLDASSHFVFAGCCGLAGTRFGLGLYSTDPEAITSAALPMTPPAISAFETRTFGFSFDSGITVNGELTSLFLIPEPSPGAVLALGLAALWLRRRYDSRSR